MPADAAPARARARRPPSSEFMLEFVYGCRGCARPPPRPRASARGARRRARVAAHARCGERHCAQVRYVVRGQVGRSHACGVPRRGVCRLARRRGAHTGHVTAPPPPLSAQAGPAAAPACCSLRVRARSRASAKQRFFTEHDDDVVALCLHPKLPLVASGQARAPGASARRAPLRAVLFVLSSCRQPIYIYIYRPNCLWLALSGRRAWRPDRVGGAEDGGGTRIVHGDGVELRDAAPQRLRLAVARRALAPAPGPLPPVTNVHSSRSFHP